MARILVLNEYRRGYLLYQFNTISNHELVDQLYSPCISYKVKFHIGDHRIQTDTCKLNFPLLLFSAQIDCYCFLQVYRIALYLFLSTLFSSCKSTAFGFVNFSFRCCSIYRLVPSKLLLVL